VCGDIHGAGISVLNRGVPLSKAKMANTVWYLRNGVRYDVD